MKYFLIGERIGKDLFDKFVTFYNDNFSEKCVVVIDTIGGSTYYTETIVHMINGMPDVSVLIQNAYSAGFWIAIKVKCNLLISRYAKGMWHYQRVDISINSKNKPYYHEDECVVSNLPSETKLCEAIAKKVMTPKELKEFKRDNDVYFNAKRMKQIFPNAKIIS